MESTLQMENAVSAVAQAPESRDLARDVLARMEQKGWNIGAYGHGIWEDTEDLLTLWIAFTSPDFHEVAQDPDDPESDYLPELEDFADAVLGIIHSRGWIANDYSYEYYSDRPPSDYLRIE
ncbi:hypothetical protein [Sphaerisporangium dianthi]|uniref:Uncharacterized protein n=1 Tax=Sphaerisporangium dianthi TaxID=1436120 RepID=A0ABV9C873_9ACTN